MQKGNVRNSTQISKVFSRLPSGEEEVEEGDTVEDSVKDDFTGSVVGSFLRCRPFGLVPLIDLGGFRLVNHVL